MSPEFWFMSIVTVTGAAWGVGMAVGEARFVSAQHNARRLWEQTGRAVTGWSSHWQWAYDEVEDRPSLRNVAIDVFTAVAKVAHVAHTHVRALAVEGRLRHRVGDRR